MHYLLFLLISLFPFSSYALQIQLGTPDILTIDKIKDIHHVIDDFPIALGPKCLFISDFDLTLAWTRISVQQGEQVQRFQFANPLLSLGPYEWNSSYEEIIREIKFEKAVEPSFRGYLSDWLPQYTTRYQKVSALPGLTVTRSIVPVEEAATVDIIQGLLGDGVEFQVLTRGGITPTRIDFLKNHFFRDQSLDQIREGYFHSKVDKAKAIVEMIRDKKPKYVLVLDDNSHEISRLIKLLQDKSFLKENVGDETSWVYPIHYTYFHHQFARKNWSAAAIKELKEFLGFL